MGETPKQPFQLSFNPSLKVDFQVSRVPSDGGLILVRELDERLGFSEQAYNGHFESTCYHPLLFNGKGDGVAAKLRPGNVHSAEVDLRGAGRTGREIRHFASRPATACSGTSRNC